MAFLKEKIELELQEAELAVSQSLGGVSTGTKYFLIFCLLACLPAYYLTKAGSGAYWNSRYSSSRFQARESFTAPKPLKIGSLYITTSSANAYAIAASITNENVDLSIDSVPVEIKVYDKNNQEIGSAEDTFYIFPNQTKFVTAPKILTHDAVASAQVVFPKELPWKRNLQIPDVPLTTGLTTVYNQMSPLAFVVQSSVENHSPYTLNKVTLVILLSDSAGQVIGVGQRNEFNVGPFERRSIQQLWPGVSNSGAAKATVMAYTNALDPANLIIRASDAAASSLQKPKRN